MTQAPLAAFEIVWEDSGCALLARVRGNSAANVTQATISSIALSVFDLTSATPDTATTTATPVVASTIFDTLQTDDRWTKDTTGYNFAYAVPAATLATGGRIYQFEFLLTPSSGEVFHVVFQVETARLRRS